MLFYVFGISSIRFPWKHWQPPVWTVYIEMKGKSNKAIIGLIYRLQGQRIEVDHTLSELFFEPRCRCDSVIMGNFILRVARGDDPYNSHTGRGLYTNLSIECFVSLCLQTDSRNNILNLILITTETLVNEVNVLPTFSSSDHQILTLIIKVKENKSIAAKEKVQITRELISLDFGQYCIMTTGVISRNRQISIKYGKSSPENYSNAIKLYVPYRNRRRPFKNKSKWWNNEIENILSLKKKVHSINAKQIKIKLTN